MAKHIQVQLDTAPACLYLADFTNAHDLSEYLKSHPQWEKIHDRVLSEYRQPWVALVWRGYKPGLTAEQDVMLDIYGVTLITPVEAQEMRFTLKSSSFINRN
jgi:hypothetical protein